jgi:hypothetical protein
MGEMKNQVLERSYLEGALDERKRFLGVCHAASCSDGVGDYVYLRDLVDYLEDPDEPDSINQILGLLKREFKRNNLADKPFHVVVENNRLIKEALSLIRKVR